MSSTNRSSAREKHVSDYYVTPVSSILDFLSEFLQEEIMLTNSNLKILDPCAGGDLEHEMSYPKALTEFGFKGQITTLDIRADSKAELKGSFLEHNCKDQFDIIITNPPFNQALEIINKALSDVKDNGFVIMLLRLNFFGSKARKEFFDKSMPKYAFVHSKRMKFTNTAGTDSIEYMHACWQKNKSPKFTLLRII